MRQTNRLTVKQIAAAGPGRLTDGGGLYLDRTATGGKWSWRYVLAGQRREMGLGTLADVSLADARRARDRWAAILRDGKDPISERSRLAEAERAALDRSDPTLADVAQMAFDARKASLRGDGERGRWFSPIRVHVLPTLGPRRVSSIHQRDIRDTLARVWRDHPATAEKTIQRLAAIYTYARRSGYPCHEDTVDNARHMLGDLRRAPENIAATPWQEIPDLFRALTRPAASFRALRWIILTATRSDSARGARFSEIDGATWTVPAERMKGREGQAQPFRVPLSTAALDLLEECRDVSEDGLLFPGYRRGHPITQNALLKTLNEMGQQGRPHGMRTSFRTWCQDHDISYDIAERSLAHVVGNRVERAYARSDLLDQRRALMQRWADYVTAAPAVVVQLRG